MAEETKDIFHSGVLGMKWGRRKGVGTDIASDGVRLKGPDGKGLIVSKEYYDKSGRLVVQYGGKKTSAVGELLSKTPTAKAINKIKEYAAKVKAADDAKKTHNDEVEKRLNEMGDKYDKASDSANASITKGTEKAKYGFSAAERAAGKAQIREGEALLKQAGKELDSAYETLPPYKVTTGIAINRVILAGSLGLMVYGLYQDATR